MSSTSEADRLAEGAGLSDTGCPTCGAGMNVACGEVPAVVNGERIVVPAVDHLRCPACGEVVLRYEDAKALQMQGQEAYRRRHGLLTAEEIRALRQTLGMTQAQLADLLQLGPNTVSRWESGRNVQSGALDLLLKLLRDVPGTLAYLRQRAA